MSQVPNETSTQRQEQWIFHVPQRRSSRTTFHLPTSAITPQTTVSSHVKYTHYSDAICRLGKSLQEIYDKKT